MHDRDGKLLLQAVRSMNMLYKVHMGIREPMCLIPMMVSESSRWHIRLGNINHESLLVNGTAGACNRNTAHYN